MTNGENFTTGTTPLAVNTPRQLLVKILRATNSAGSGGGGGGSGSVTSGNGLPSSTPTGAAIYYDNLTGIIYEWNGSAWV